MTVAPGPNPMSKHKRVMLAAAIGTLALGAACGSNEDESGRDDLDRGGEETSAAIVAIRDDVYEPTQIAVNVGDGVVWQWKGKNPHNVSGDGFASKIQTDGTFRHTFDAAGTYDYTCTVHPRMKASVVVGDA